MSRYILKRIALGILTILISFTFTFFLIRFAPGDPIKIMAGRENPSASQIEYIQKLYGLDQPLMVQFTHYLGNLLKGDFGFSFKNNQPIVKIILSRIRPTILLTLTSSLLSAVCGTLLGILVVRMKKPSIERTLLRISYFVDAIPTFWLGLILIIFFAGKMKWFPTSGMHDVRNQSTGIQKILDIIHHMVLPVITIVIVQVPIYFRVIRSSILNTMGDDYIKTFRAAGLSEAKIFHKYILKNSILPIIVLFGSSLAFTISGVALIEIIFAWPGMGRLILQAVSSRDYMLLNGIYLMISASIIIFMILIDIVQAVIDPRIRWK